MVFLKKSSFQMKLIDMQNSRILASENSRAIVHKPLHSTRVTVWCAFWSEGDFGPYFFENETGNAVTVNGFRYRDMLTDLFWPIIDYIDVSFNVVLTGQHHMLHNH